MLPPSSSSSCISYDLGPLLEEELILTPTHTPSQSFDFIVWDKAYLDSIPSMRAPSNHSIIRCDHVEGDDNQNSGGGADFPKKNGEESCIHKDASDGCDGRSDQMQEVLQKEQEPADVRSHWRLMQSCRTDMDLPCFLQYCRRNKEENNNMMLQGQRVQAKHGTSSLQEAVMRLYDAGHYQECYNDHNEDDQIIINHDYGYKDPDEDYIDYDDHAESMRPPCNYCCGYGICPPSNMSSSAAARATILKGSDGSDDNIPARDDEEHRLGAGSRISEVKIVSVSFRRSFSQPAAQRNDNHTRLIPGLAAGTANHGTNDSNNHHLYYGRYYRHNDDDTVAQIQHMKVCFPAHKLFGSPGRRTQQGHGHGPDHGACPHTCSLPAGSGTRAPWPPRSVHSMGATHFFGHHRSYHGPSPRAFTSHAFHTTTRSPPHHTSWHRLRHLKSLWKKLWSQP